MSDNLLHKYAGRVGERAATYGAADADLDDVDDLGAFGWLRGIRDRALMLEMRKRNGNIVAIGYGWIERAEFDPSEGITLHVLGKKVGIKGRNLNQEVRPMVKLFEGIARHRVPWVRESLLEGVRRDPLLVTVVEQIEW
jgi:hypothetical protein